jgi:hypothetical protein
MTLADLRTRPATRDPLVAALHLDAPGIARVQRACAESFDSSSMVIEVSCYSSASGPTSIRAAAVTSAERLLIRSKTIDASR